MTKTTQSPELMIEVIRITRQYIHNEVADDINEAIKRFKVEYPESYEKFCKRFGNDIAFKYQVQKGYFSAEAKIGHIISMATRIFNHEKDRLKTTLVDKNDYCDLISQQINERLYEEEQKEKEKHEV